jgi:hypothetical protein
MTKDNEIKKPDFTPVSLDNLKIFKQMLVMPGYKTISTNTRHRLLFFYFWKHFLIFGKNTNMEKNLLLYNP